MLNKPIKILISFFVVFSFVMSFALHVSAEPSEVANLSNTSGESRRVQLFVQGENVYSVWTDDAPGNSDVFFAKSNGGASFVDHLNISNNNGSSAFPRLVVSEPNVYVVWYDYSPGQSDIFFAQSNDTGKNFHVIHIRSPEPSYNPWIAAWSNYVYLVWNDGGRTTTIDLPNGETRIVDVTTGDEEIFFGVSEDDGETFEFSNLSNSPSQMSWNSRIRAFDSNVYVTWNERIGDFSDIFFSASYDNGKTFADPINVSNNPQTSMDAGIAISENKIYLIWHQKTPETTDIFYSMSADKGSTFSIPINLSISPAASQIVRDAQIAVSDNKIFIVWYEEANQGSEVFFTRSVDSGLTFSKPINLSQTNDKSELPQIVSNGENVFVMWHDYSQGNGDIFLRESNDYGATFGSIKNLSDDEAESNIFILGPQIFFSENRVYTSWQNSFDNSTDLFLMSFAPSEKKDEGKMLLTTLNGATNIEVEIDGKTLEIDKPTNITLRFFEPSVQSVLKDVHYSLEVSDYEGKSIVNLQNYYTQSGVDSHEIMFTQEGPSTIQIEIHGTGQEHPYDTKNSGKASVTITVVPEFPSGVMMSLVAIMGLGVAVTIYQKIRHSPLWSISK